MRRAKTVCTLGPASSSPEVLDGLISAGMDCARLNFSHGSHETHAETARLVREIAERRGRMVAIMADLQGPKIRLGIFSTGPVHLETGQSYVLSGVEGPCNAERAYVSYEALARDVHEGDDILIDDGLVHLRVRQVDYEDVVCDVIFGGTLSDRKGVNFPGTQLSVPALTEKDRADLHFAVHEVAVDFVALSFVRRANDVLQAKALAGHTPVIAKLEKPQAVGHLEEILDAADGVMVARGDLGVEMGAEKVPIIQKRIIAEANRRRKLVITATQMLDSMIRNPRPTRAEAADVANAILDGTDAVMLSGETATGAHPIAALLMMDKIVREAERELSVSADFRNLAAVRGEWQFDEAAARAAAVMTLTLPLVAVVTVSPGSQTPALLSSYRPAAPIVAITTSMAAARQLALYWGVVPKNTAVAESFEEYLQLARRVAREMTAPNEPCQFALVGGWPAGSRTNTVTLQRLES